MWILMCLYVLNSVRETITIFLVSVFHFYQLALPSVDGDRSLSKSVCKRLGSEAPGSILESMVSEPELTR